MSSKNVAHTYQVEKLTVGFDSEKLRLNRAQVKQSMAYGALKHICSPPNIRWRTPLAVEGFGYTDPTSQGKLSIFMWI